MAYVITFIPLWYPPNKNHAVDVIPNIIAHNINIKNFI